MSQRLQDKFALLKNEGRTGLVTYVMAYDPNLSVSQEILDGLPGAGADIIELGMPFSDPMADGETIQKAAIRALDSKATMRGVLDMVVKFRKNDENTPLVLMGYYNPVQHYGLAKFMSDASDAGVDAMLIVDLSPEEDDELFALANAADIDLIKLVTPTTDEERLNTIIKKASGFLYYVAVTGVTGADGAAYNSVADALSFIKQKTSMPVAVGFGIKTSEDVARMGACADAVVVGSALINRLENTQSAAEVLELVQDLSVSCVSD